ncbi:site-specific tyrosine recombinase XerD [Arachnia propionica]|uniref:Tyrosine recombinase XerC n=1 Tax=Arachnia propionica TaxID=1750 RepID=A0A3P1WY31_9ACTN|nr:site-specific tyrosine recombinase XerD [Arachnia propionica]RRD49313.1 site-specific tyrosine recombinase XerD [Arachnia propionica]
MSVADDAVGQYLAHIGVERGLRANTVAAYRRDLSRYLQFLADRGITDLAEVTPVEISEYVRHLGTQLRTSSVARQVTSVRNLHAFALGEGVTTTNPAQDIAPPAVGKRLPKALTVDEVLAVLGVPDRADPIGLRDAALLELLYGTGARVSEITALDVDEVTTTLADPETGLRLVGKGGKERMVPLGGFAREAVDAYLVRSRPGLATKGDGGGALLLNRLGRRLSRSSAHAIVAECARRAGVTKEVSPHSLRHSYATHLLEGGADVRVVQELLGHASVATTQIYTLVTIDQLREVYQGAHPRAR